MQQGMDRVSLLHYLPALTRNQYVIMPVCVVRLAAAAVAAQRLTPLSRALLCDSASPLLTHSLLSLWDQDMQQLLAMTVLLY